MAQKTNLNSAPYYDDFDKDKNFVRTLFRPGFAIQARELTQLQSQLQYQIETHGSHIFKEGALVVPGVNGIKSYESLKLATQFGSESVDPSKYYNATTPVIITGATTGVKAEVIGFQAGTTTEQPLLFLNYTRAGTDNSTTKFSDTENISANVAIQHDTVSYDADVASATTFTATSTDATSATGSAAVKGSAYFTKAGIYYVRGFFVAVTEQVLTLDPYNRDFNGFVGFDITETLVTPETDTTLLDNAQGSSNFAAKGAHRLQLTLTLAKKTTATNADFVQVAQIKNGVVVAQGRETEYSVLSEEFARRTFDESGNYTVRPFQFNVEECVTVNENTGRFAVGATTDDGNIASSDLLAIKISPAKAYVNGFEIEKNVPTIKDINKARDFETKNADITVFDTGNFTLITNIYGTPDISEVASETTPFKEVQFYDTPTSSRGTANGTLIGVGRARSMQFSAGVGGSSSSNNTSVYRLYLFDLRPFTILTLSDTPSPTLTANHADGVQVTGVTSGATGFVFGEGTSGTNVNLTNVVGTFVAGEKITASDSAESDDIVENSGNTDLTISTVVTKSFADFRQVFMDDPTNADEDFTADLVTEAETQVDFVLLEDSASRSEGSIVLEEDNSTVVSLERVDQAKLKDAEKNIALFKPSKNVVKTHLTTANDGASDTQFTIRKQFVGTTDSSGAVSFTAATGETFVGFSESDYTLSVLDIGSGGTHADGDIVSVSGNISGTGTNQITITDSAFNGSKVKLLATLLKTSVIQKNKTVQLMKQLKVVAGDTDAYGTRPTDRDISLGRADVFKLVAVFDSEDSSTDASAPTLTLGAITGTFTRGEKITGSASGATGRIIDITSPMSYVLTSVGDFTTSDTITGESSGASADVSTVTSGSVVITSDFLLDTGMRDNFYDISRLVRKPSVPSPQGRLLVVYDYMEHGTGDVMTVDSYTDVANQMDYEDIPTYSASKVDPDDPEPTGSFPLYETYDFRPRIADIAGASSTLSVVDEITGNSFDFTSRVFSGTGSSYSNFGKPASNIQSDLEYFLPKKASIFLDDRGQVVIREGASSERPRLPTPVDNAMKLGDLSLPAFTFKPRDVKLTRERTQRFTMRDIGRIEQRLTNVERTTTLSLLEKDAQSFETTDANGLNRFKSGFLVDSFRGHSVGDTQHPDYRNSMDMQLGELRPVHKTKGIDLIEQATTDTARTAAGYQKTGDLLTLPYTEEVITEQPFATTLERVTPFLTASWNGKIILDPDQDSWFETEVAPEIVINVEGNFDAVEAANRNQLGTVWNAWQDTWSGRIRTIGSPGEWQPGSKDSTPSTLRTVETGTSRRTGTRTFVEESVERESQGFRTISKVAIPVVRARNVRFDAEGLRPFTRVYVFFDKTDVNAYVTPDADSTTDTTPAAGSPLIVKSDSRCGGTFAIPDPKISGNPQFQTGDILFKITASSTDENDPTTFAQTTYSAKGILETQQETIVATRNGRVATENVSQSRGTARPAQAFGANNDGGDDVGDGSSCFVAGTMVRMTDGSDKKIEDVQIGDILLGMDGAENTVLEFDHPMLDGRDLIGINGSGPFKTPEHPLLTKDGWKAYNSQDTIEQKPQIAHLMTNGNLEVGDEIKDINGNWILVESLEVFENEEEQQVYNFVLDGNNTYHANGLVVHNRDPLCQTFIIADEDKQFESDLGGTNSDAGRFVTSIDLFFSAKDDTLPLSVEIRNVVNGYPGPKVLPFSRVTLSPSEVNVSADGKTATKFTFKSPVYLQSMAEYCFVVLTNTPKYIMWISDLGQEDSDGNLVSEQPHIGVLFKGHNNRTWVASPTQDAKFTLRAAKFDTAAAGVVTITNDTLPSLTLGKNPLVMTNGNTALKVNHFDHHMYSTTNNVTISGVKSGAETTLNGAISSSATTITLTSGTNFDDTSGKFSRNASNVYFIKIGDEVISYTSISGNVISGATRGVEGTAVSHTNGSTVELYMLHKVPFTEINKTHTAIANIGTDYYTVALSTTPVVASSGDSSFGGTVVTATENAMYDVSSTVLGTLVPPECDILTKNRQTTATSSSGSETSFSQASLTNAETIPLNDNYYYEDPHMVASEINETNEMSGSKSLILPITLSSTNNSVSPVIDLKRMTFLAIANRINQIDSSSDVYPTSIYDPMTDPEGDDHDAIYVTKRATLENPATSIRVIFDANREDTADIKVLFRTLRTDDASDFDELDFKFFNDGGTVATSGGPDVAVSPSLGISQFNEYEFTAGVTDDGIGTPLDEFIAFQIKIVMRATNSARPPRIKDLRVLALAT